MAVVRNFEAIVVPLDLGPQDVCSFYTYSAQESLRELGEILDTLGTQEQRIEGSGCFGGFLVICNARGTYLHNGKQNVESNVLTSALPNTPVIGFFANGEVGPMPFREYFAAPRGGEGGESGEAQHVAEQAEGEAGVVRRHARTVLVSGDVGILPARASHEVRHAMHGSQEACKAGHSEGSA